MASGRSFVGRANSLVGRLDLAFLVLSHPRLLYIMKRKGTGRSDWAAFSVDHHCVHATFGKCGLPYFGVTTERVTYVDYSWLNSVRLNYFFIHGFFFAYRDLCHASPAIFSLRLPRVCTKCSPCLLLR